MMLFRPSSVSHPYYSSRACEIPFSSPPPSIVGIVVHCKAPTRLSCVGRGGDTLSGTLSDSYSPVASSSSFLLLFPRSDLKGSEMHRWLACCGYFPGFFRVNLVNLPLLPRVTSHIPATDDRRLLLPIRQADVISSYSSLLFPPLLERKC